MLVRPSLPTPTLYYPAFDAQPHDELPSPVAFEVCKIERLPPALLVSLPPCPDCCNLVVALLLRLADPSSCRHL